MVTRLVFVNHADGYKLASLEQKAGSLAEDIVIHYGLKRPISGIDLMTSRTPGDDGFFYLTITAGDELSAQDVGHGLCVPAGYLRFHGQQQQTAHLAAVGGSLHQ